MCSRLSLDASGRQIVTVTTPSPGLPTGTRFVVLGNLLEVGGPGVGWLGRRTGRQPTRNETAGIRQPLPLEAGS